MSSDDDATMPDTRPGAPRAPLRLAPSDLGERYLLRDVIGRGGMGEVRLARDVRIDRDVAIKLLRTTASDDATQGRFFREARVQGVLEHPAIVPVHDLGIDHEGSPYFVMKRLTGTTLADVLHGSDPALQASWTRRTLLTRFVDVCLAIEFAHQRGVIHRDLKPANIMLGEYGEAYVLDWGLARISDDHDSLPLISPLSGDDLGHTAAGDLLGTPGYMSPEQARGESVDCPTDVFALGCVLFEILVGSPALPRGIAAIATTLSIDSLRPSDRSRYVPPELDDVCARATSATASARPTARELAHAVQAYLDGDRDLEQRHALAATAAATATDALSIPGDDGRATAMREAGRALALDPANASAQSVLAHLLLEVPDTIPAEALAIADEERGRVRQAVIKKAAWSYAAGALVLAVLFTMPVRHAWPIVFGIAMAIVTAVSLFAMARRPLSMRSPAFLVIVVMNCIVIGTTGLIFGPLLILPFILIGSLSGFVSQHSHVPLWLITAIHVAVLLSIFALELAGVVPRTFTVADGSIAITPWALTLNTQTLMIVFGLAFVMQIGSTLDLQGGLRRAQERAQDQIHAQSWHLRQLLPRAGASLASARPSPSKARP